MVSERSRGGVPSFAFRIAGLAIIAVGASYVAASTNSTDGLFRLLRNGAVAAAILCAILIVLTCLQFANRSRIAQFRRQRPGSVVFAATTGQLLREALTALAPSKVATLPIYLPVVADETGVEIWGSAGYPGLIFSAKWLDVDSIVVTKVSEQGRLFRGLELTISGMVPTPLPLIVVGAGLTGTSNESTAELARLCARLEQLRHPTAGRTITPRAE